MGDQVPDHRIIEMVGRDCGSLWKMDLAAKLEKTFNIPRLALAFLAIIFGILVLVFPYILNVLVALFLILWGLWKASASWERSIRGRRRSVGLKSQRVFPNAPPPTTLRRLCLR